MQRTQRMDRKLVFLFKSGPNTEEKETKTADRNQP